MFELIFFIFSKLQEYLQLSTKFYHFFFIQNVLFILSFFLEGLIFHYKLE